MDANYFAHHFRALLTDLTFNSKVIIDELTRMSQDVQHSRFVAQCLDEHIMAVSAQWRSGLVLKSSLLTDACLKCPPQIRLPALYTLDSICKNAGHPYNIGQPYTGLWSPRIAHIFLESYRIVDQSTKVRLEELLATWRYAGVNNTPLFGEPVQHDIERRLFGNPIIAPPPEANFGANVHTQAQRHHIVQRIDRLLTIGSHDNTRMQALAKLRALVADVPLSNDELLQIAQQLDVLEMDVAPVPTIAPIVSSNPPPPPPQASNAILPPNLAGALANLGKLGSATPPVNHATAVGSAPTAAAGTALGAPAIDLIAKLQQAGLFRAPAISVVQQDLEYSNMILSLNLKLTTGDMQRELPLGSLEAIQFKELPLQCRQCANRYPSGPKGQTSMDQHLDWHFRQNRRARDSTARGQSRSWFSRLEDWIRGGHDDDTPSKRHEDAAGGENGRGVTSLTPAQEAELKAATSAFVIAPIDDPEAATRPCPICKELFKSEMSQDEDDFIWKNAVNIKGVYYHGSCHYSAKIFSSSVKSSTGSREGTPSMEEQHAAKAATGSRLSQIKEEEGGASLAGTKRKAEEEDDSEQDGAVKAARPLVEVEGAA